MRKAISSAILSFAVLFAGLPYGISLIRLGIREHRNDRIGNTPSVSESISSASAHNLGSTAPCVSEVPFVLQNPDLTYFSDLQVSKRPQAGIESSSIRPLTIGSVAYFATATACAPKVLTRKYQRSR